MRTSVFLAAPFLLGSILPAASGEGIASPWLDFREARVRIIAERPESGRDFRGGIEIRLADGYKTYWRSPGESGVPPMFDFSKSSGLTDPAVSFPFPAVFDDGAGGKAWGYRHAVVLPIRAGTAASGPVLALKLDFAVCGTICIPLSGKLVLDAARAHRLPPPELARLALAESRIPRRPGGGIVIRRLATAESGGKWRVSVPLSGDAGEVRAFPEGQSILDVHGIEPEGEGRISILLSGAPAAGSGGKYGKLRLTYGHSAAAYEAEFDLDGAPGAP